MTAKKKAAKAAKSATETATEAEVHADFPRPPVVSSDEVWHDALRRARTPMEERKPIMILEEDPGGVDYTVHFLDGRKDVKGKMADVVFSNVSKWGGRQMSTPYGEFWWDQSHWMHRESAAPSRDEFPKTKAGNALWFESVFAYGIAKKLVKTSKPKKEEAPKEEDESVRRRKAEDRIADIRKQISPRQRRTRR